jgi:hypothetical protein
MIIWSVIPGISKIWNVAQPVGVRTPEDDCGVKNPQANGDAVYIIYANRFPP